MVDTDDAALIRTALKESLDNAEYRARRSDPDWDGTYHPTSPLGNLHAAQDALIRIAAARDAKLILLSQFIVDNITVFDVPTAIMEIIAEQGVRWHE